MDKKSRDAFGCIESERKKIMWLLLMKCSEHTELSSALRQYTEISLLKLTSGANLSVSIHRK